MTSYRQLIHFSNIDLCELSKNPEANVFLKGPLQKIKAAFPGADFKCPYRVNKFQYFSFYLLQTFCDVYRK